ncbi:MAG: DNA adenine methylase [Planctomycetaceae bacterium]|nr:DNA adenine methylase [Planctomycetaceae bacterium]
MNELTSAWWSAIEGLPEIHQRLKRVVLLQDDALKVIKQQDGLRTLFYCDPPYLHETRTAIDVYQHEMSIHDQESLLKTLGELQGRFLLRVSERSL